MKKMIMILSLVIGLNFTNTSQAQQISFIGEVQMFGGNFAPRDWAFCNGQLLSISENAALFSIIGTTYGGDGRVTFALPDLRGRVPMHKGNGPGLSNYSLGQKGGQENVTIDQNTMPTHTHANQVNASSADGEKGLGAVWAKGANYATSSNAQMSSSAVQLSSSGGSQAHTNIAPFKTVNYIICLNGTYPVRD